MTSYCIDRTEVTQSQYAKFLAATVEPVDQVAECVLNQTFVPDTETGGCTPDSFDPSVNPDHPVVCVDWCDAAAYCGWAGKRLCRGIAGVDLSNNRHGSAGLSEWHNACSAGQKNRFPYGNDFEPDTCNGKRYEAESTIAVGSAGGCVGVDPPFNRVFDMSGNVAEWTDACFPWFTTPPQEDHCPVRGGSFESAFMECYAGGGWVVASDERNDVRNATGFRCCLD